LLKASKYNVNNFTGNYIGLGTSRGFVMNKDKEVSLLSAVNSIGQTYNLSFGRQQKFGKWGYVDLGATLEYFTASESLQLGLKMHTGLAFGKSRSVDDNNSLNRYTDFKDEYKVERGIFKISDPILFLGRDLSSIGFNLEYERYVLKNLSLNSSLNFSLLSQVVPQHWGNVEAEDYSAGLGFHLRYYYNQNKRLRQGRGSDSFSGSYLELGVKDLYRWGRSNAKYDDGRPPTSGNRSGSEYLRIGAVWGVQERIGKKGIFKLAAGVEYDPRYGDIEIITRGSIGLIIGK